MGSQKLNHKTEALVMYGTEGGGETELMYLMGSHKLKLKTEALIVYGRRGGLGV